MKITSIECLILEGEYPFVLVHTDDGLTGIGECFRRQPSVTKSMIDDIITPSIIGKNPVETDARYRDMIHSANALEI